MVCPKDDWRERHGGRTIEVHLIETNIESQHDSLRIEPLQPLRHGFSVGDRGAADDGARRSGAQHCVNLLRVAKTAAQTQ